MAAFWIEIDGNTVACEHDTLEQAQRSALAQAEAGGGAVFVKVTTVVGGLVPLTETYWDSELGVWVSVPQG